MKTFRELDRREHDSLPTFGFSADGGKHRYSLVDAYCDDPECEGTEIYIHLLPDLDTSRRISFWANLFEGRVRWDEKPAEESERVAVEFAGAAAHQRFLRRRRQLVRGWALGKLAGKAEYEPGRTYCFRDFAREPEDFLMPFEGEGHDWCVLDHYCVNPGCACQKGYLDFYEIDPHRSVQEPAHHMTVDLRDGRAQAREEGALSEEVLPLWAAFQAELGGWLEDLRRRRQILRGVARQRLRYPVSRRELRAETGSVVSPVVKVGRNDPCPCGSGKKFKRCCG